MPYLTHARAPAHQTPIALCTTGLRVHVGEQLCLAECLCGLVLRILVCDTALLAPDTPGDQSTATRVLQPCSARAAVIS